MLLIFDWDGTLVDSADKIVRCMQRAAERAQVEVLPTASIRQIIGLGLPEAMATLYPALDDASRLRVREEYVHCFVNLDQTPAPFFPAVEETLQRLRDAGYPLAVATGKSRRGLDRALQQLGMQDFFHATRCADETRSKPHPQMLHELLAQSGRGPQEAIMVGDTHFDMAMAQAVGMPRIAVSYGAHDPSQLWPHEPLACVDRFEQILQVIAAVKAFIAGGSIVTGS